MTALRLKVNFLDQGATHRLDDISLDLIAQPVWVDDLTAVMRSKHAIDLDRARAAIDRHVSDNRNVCSYQLILRVGDAASMRDSTPIARTSAARLPFCELSQALQQIKPALIGQVTRSDLKRIGCRSGGDLVKEAFVAEGILQASRRAYPGRG